MPNTPGRFRWVSPRAGLGNRGALLIKGNKPLWIHGLFVLVTRRAYLLACSASTRVSIVGLSEVTRAEAKANHYTYHKGVKYNCGYKVKYELEFTSLEDEGSDKVRLGVILQQRFCEIFVVVNRYTIFVPVMDYCHRLVWSGNMVFDPYGLTEKVQPVNPVLGMKAFVVAETMWYGSTTTPIELFGPTHYQWDQGYFSQEIYRRFSVGLVENQSLSEAWSKIPEK
ncbi:hypothetical protein HAX54_014459 [Datura stramonium]|uniref:Uncharacterized protein n=1 Tax=Datura stramonium TaxID=4076 RepID=A0ABS8RIP4_DATST|nr:hypothetical protein [Datura stramonium]